MAHLLGISGALRKSSFNRKLIREAFRLSAFDDYTEADLLMPLYDGDVEETSGVPAVVETLAAQIAAADAVVIATPEYNKGISGVLKNALDWVSRSDVKPWGGKPVAIVSATAGRGGGERAQANLRLAIQPFRPRILQGPEILLAANYAQFDDNDHLKEDSYITALTELMEALHAEVK